MGLFTRSPEARIEFVWVVRDKGTHSSLLPGVVTSLKKSFAPDFTLDTPKWFENEIRILEAAPQVHLSLYVPSELADPGNSAASGSWELSQTVLVAHEAMPIHGLPEVQPSRPVLADVVRNAVTGLKRNDPAVVVSVG
jgi:hypothetical protein